MKEFKVGDKCYREYTAKEIVDDILNDYPVILESLNGSIITCTEEGKVHVDDKNISLKHIEDITPKPEFPKWMMVKTGVTWEKRKVISKDDTGYCYIMYGKDEISAGIGVVSLSSVKEIEPENNKLQELEEKYKELGKEIEKLKNKQ